MQDDLTIPKTIKIGFQKRSDTYTGMLAYVVYVDAKGKLRKQTSWDGWRDKKIDAQDHENEPTAGFVLNKDVGGTRRSYGWNARVEKVRVYDPRGFEFEISIPNLLFILEESSAIKGKGLEGEFVYSWSGPELILLPVSSQKYKESTAYNVLQTEKVAAKDVIPGCTFTTKKREEVMYLGKFAWFDKKGSYYYDNRGKIFGQKRHVFVRIDALAKKEDDDDDCVSRGNNFIGDKYWLQTGFVGLAKKTSETPVPQFADEYDKLMKSNFTSVPVKLVTKPLKKKAGRDARYYGVGGDYGEICVETPNGIMWGSAENHSDGRWGWSYNGEDRSNKPRKYDVRCSTQVSVDKGEVVTKDMPASFARLNITEEEVLTIGKDLFVVCENGAEYKYE